MDKEKNDREDDEKLEKLIGHIGEFGRYQLCQFLLHILGGFTAGVHMMSMMTISPVPDHRCAIPNVEASGGKMLDWKSAEVLKWIPKTSDGKLDSCLLINQSTNETYACSEWVYDTERIKSSRAIEWNYVCKYQWMEALSKSAYFFGVFIGAVTLGRLADKYGRKTIFVISAVLQLVFGVTVAFIPEYYTLLILTIFYGIFGSAGCYITGFVLTMELVGPKWRTVCGVSFQIMFAIGIMVVGAWALVIHDRMWLQFCYGLHSLVLIGHWWLMDESPRWLWSQNQRSKATKIISKAAKKNKLDPVDRAKFLPTRSGSGSRHSQRSRRSSHSSFASIQLSGNNKYGLLDLFKTPRLCFRTINICLNWFANSLAYYGMTLGIGPIGGSLFVSMIIMGALEIPVYILTILILDKTGRRFLTALPLLIGGGACVASSFTPAGTATTVIQYFGRFWIACSFAVIYNYSTELFPTVVRNSAMGLGSMCARTSGTLTPFVPLLGSFDTRLPKLVFGGLAVIAGLLTTVLPETLKKPMPQTIQDGEDFGRGDTCFTTGCFGRKVRLTAVPVDEPAENS